MMRFVLIFCVLMLCFEQQILAQLEIPGLQPDAEKIKIAREMEATAETLKDSVMLGKAYFMLAEAFNMGGQQTTSRSFYIRAINILKPRGDFKETGMALLRLNQGINLLPESREDIENADTALSIFRRLKSYSNMALAYNYMTSAYKRQWLWNAEELAKIKDHPARVDTLMMCIDNIAKYGRLAKDTAMIAESYLQLGDYQRNLRDRNSILNFNQALDLIRKQKNDTSTIHALCHIAISYLDFGDEKGSEKCIQEAQHLLKIHPIEDYWLNTHLLETSVAYYQRTKDWPKAFAYLKSLSALYTYRAQGERDYLVNAINVGFETEKKENLIREQKNQLENLYSQRRFNFATSALLIMTIGTSIVFYRLNRKNQRVSRQNQQLVKEQNHRVKNNLQVVSSLLSLQADQLTDDAARQAVEESQLRIQAIAILHHKLYDGTRLAKVDLQELIPELTNVVLRTFGETNVEPEFLIDSVFLSADKATPLALILNELVTNICKHALPGNHAPEFNIILKRNEHNLHLEVSDNGPGLSALKVNTLLVEDLLKVQSGSFGIPLIQSQVAQLKGKGSFKNRGKSGTTFVMDFMI